MCGSIEQRHAQAPVKTLGRKLANKEWEELMSVSVVRPGEQGEIPFRVVCRLPSRE
jgi:hypothetical protein